MILKRYWNDAVSITKRNGLTENYFNSHGAVYVNPSEKMIKTAFKAGEYKGDTIMIMEVLKKYGYE